MKTRLFLLLLALCTFLSLSGCGGVAAADAGGHGSTPPSPSAAASFGPGANSLWASASPSTSALTFYFHDGRSGWSGWISDLPAEREILSRLSAVDAVPVEDWTAELVTYPLYGITIGTTDGQRLAAVWSGGHLILRDGSAYRFDFDFSSLVDAYGWTSRLEISAPADMPCGRCLAQSGDRWIAAHLAPAATLTPPEGVSMELISLFGDTLTLSLTNTGSAQWLYGEFFGLEVLLDGTWYVVPPLHDQVFLTIGYLLLPGASQEIEHSLAMYGQLPSGTYRLVKEGLQVEFSL